MVVSRVSETCTENIFRDYYGATTFIEKSAIPKKYGFKSKSGTGYAGYPDFFKDMGDFVILVEAKALKHSDAESETLYYMDNNKIYVGIVGVAVSGQDASQLKVTYYYKKPGEDEINSFQVKDRLISIDHIRATYQKKIAGEFISDEELTLVIKGLNDIFHQGNKVRDTDRSLFFSGILIALRNDDFRATYKAIQPPSEHERATTDLTLLAAHNLNRRMLDAVDTELKAKVNSLSKEFSWRDRFSFISNIDYPLDEYKEIIETIEKKIYIPFINDEKQDVLGKAYKIFLSRSGSTENKNIILTPDHIKSLMVKLARLDITDVVIDTCMGSGGFLMEALEILLNLAGDDVDRQDKICTQQLIGFENDAVLFALACSNMFLHGDGRSNLLYRSSLLHDAQEGIVNNRDDILFEYIRKLRPTKCIINPPYEQNSPIKFVKQALDYLEPNGRLIIIMPTPTLTKNQGNGGMTQDILAVARLDFVIKMPYALFSEQKRSVNTSIFGFTKTPHRKDDEVLFYYLEDDGFVSIQHKGRVDVNNRWNDIENDILYTVNNSKEVKGIAQKKRIYKEDILNCSGFADPKSSRHELVSFSTLFTSEEGELASTKNNSDGVYDFITASSEWKKHDKYTHDCEALIFAIKAAGSLGKSQYVNGKFIASNLCLILQRNDVNMERYPINLRFYNWYFEAIRKQLVADLADGTSKLTINATSLRSYYIEYIPIDEQDAFVEKYIVPLDNIAAQQQIAEKALTTALGDML